MPAWLAPALQFGGAALGAAGSLFGGQGNDKAARQMGMMQFRDYQGRADRDYLFNQQQAQAQQAFAERDFNTRQAQWERQFQSQGDQFNRSFNELARQHELGYQESKRQFNVMQHSGIQNRVADAKAAGVHPLFALGGSMGGSVPISVAGSPSGSGGSPQGTGQFIPGQSTSGSFAGVDMARVGRASSLSAGLNAAGNLLSRIGEYQAAAHQRRLGTLEVESTVRRNDAAATRDLAASQMMLSEGKRATSRLMEAPPAAAGTQLRAMTTRRTPGGGGKGKVVSQKARRQFKTPYGKVGFKEGLTPVSEIEDYAGEIPANIQSALMTYEAARQWQSDREKAIIDKALYGIGKAWGAGKRLAKPYRSKHSTGGGY